MSERRLSAVNKHAVDTRDRDRVPLAADQVTYNCEEKYNGLLAMRTIV